MLKHTKTLEKIITKWLKKEFDKDLSAFLGTDFGYYYNNNKIEFALVVSEKMNTWFLEFINKTFNVQFEDCFLISLLHEVGHHFTFYDIDEITESFCEDIKATLTDGTKQDAFTYFNLDDEIIATKWAINYYLTNKDKCDKMMKKINKEIRKFILLNKIEVD